MDEILHLDRTLNTPEVKLDANAGLVEISGSSFPEDGIAIYQPVLDWIGQYLLHPKDTTVNIELEYMNTVSAKILLTIFKSLSVIKKKDYKLMINWTYMEDDEDMEDTGRSFAKLANLDFNMICKPTA